MDGMGSVFSTSLFENKALKESVVWYKDIPFLCNSATVPHADSLCILDTYWPLLPLKKIMLEKIIQITLANEEAKKNPGRKPTGISENESDQSKPEVILEVCRCVQLSYLCLKYRRDLVMKHTSVTGWIRHLSITFLAANDLFLDHNVGSFLQGCLRELFKNGGYRNFNAQLDIPGLGNTFDWYKKLIEQYVAVSYGDSTFALMLLLPVLQCYPVAFRSLLWGDLSDALPLIHLKASDISTFIPVGEFMEPAERDEDMLDKYRSAMVSGFVTETRTPFLWTLAMHHVRASERRAREAASAS